MLLVISNVELIAQPICFPFRPWHNHPEAIRVANYFRNSKWKFPGDEFYLDSVVYYVKYKMTYVSRTANKAYWEISLRKIIRKGEHSANSLERYELPGRQCVWFVTTKIAARQCWNWMWSKRVWASLDSILERDTYPVPICLSLAGMDTAG